MLTRINNAVSVTYYPIVKETPKKEAEGIEMKTKNLISVYQGATALESIEPPVDKKFKPLKKHEIRNLNSFCDIMQELGCTLPTFDGYYVGYSIGQIGKEFDLLRFGDELIINIEIKSELKIANKEEKILRQMRINHYYLKFLGRKVKIFTYVENDGFYEYEEKADNLNKVAGQVVAAHMREHIVNYNIDPDKEFIPSNYLISPFNSTEKFLRGEYFLTTAQQKVKDEMYTELAETPFMYFAISANAGTGKTLLMYDIAKDMIQSGKEIAIIHCGILNDGHLKLRDTYAWNIRAIRDVDRIRISTIFDGCSAIFVDEAQRIRRHQLSLIAEKSIEKSIPIIFSYDTKQYLRDDEGIDIEEYLRAEYSKIITSPKQLTNKIRTNKELASFITNLFDMGKSQNDLNYECVTIEYMDDLQVLLKYTNFLQREGWKLLTFTTSNYNPDPYNLVASIGGTNAHNVIGQEFSKVAFIMDKNFRYNDLGRLEGRTAYYSAKGMLYQIATRVIDELKIIVLNNPKLYLKLLEIKEMGK